MNENDLRYYVSMYIVKSLLADDLITKEIYEKVSSALIEKYKPVLFGVKINENYQA